jgi:hypothetical protein
MSDAVKLTKERLISVSSEIIQRSISHKTREVFEQVNPKSFNVKFRRFDMGLMYGKLNTMNLVDLIEMAVVLTVYADVHKKDIFEVIKEHRAEFNYPKELEEILANTCRYLDWMPE